MSDMQHGITVQNLLSSFPEALKDDSDMLALATAIAEILNERVAEINDAAIYGRIDELPEDLLDILADDFKIDWWDGDYSLEEKREVLKNNWRVHKILGTKAAVETAISAIYPDTKVSEWWEYDGEPYHFRLLIDATYEKVDREKHQRVLERVEYYKNVRSVLDEIEYFSNGTAPMYIGIAFAGSEMVDSAIAQRY